MKNQLLHILIGVSVFLAGCATHTSEIAEVRSNFKNGNFKGAEAMVCEISESKKNSDDELIWLLEEGAIYRATGNLQKSIEVFNSALAKIQEFERQPEVRISEEVEAILTNQSYIPYKGYGYDKVMLSLYQSLNYIEQKDFNKASAYLLKMNVFQKDIARKNASEIEKNANVIKEAINNKNANYDVNLTLKNPSVVSQFKQVYGGDYVPMMSSENVAHYLKMASADFENPFGYWLYGVFFAATAVDNSDKSRAEDAFRICNNMLGDNSEILRADLEDIGNLRVNKPFGNVTYIVYESGLAPIRNQFRLDLPIFVIDGNIPYIAVNFPYLSFEKDYKSDIAVFADGKPAKFELIANMDSIIKKQFYNDLPMVMIKTIVSSATKATAQYFASRAAGDYGILVNILMGISQSLLNDADLRTWSTLPKQIKLARVNTPKSGKIYVDGKVIDVGREGINIIFVKRTSATSEMVIRKIDFKK